METRKTIKKLSELSDDLDNLLLDLDKVELANNIFSSLINIFDETSKIFEIIGFCLIIFMAIMGFIVDTTMFLIIAVLLSVSYCIMSLGKSYIDDKIDENLKELEEKEMKHLERIYIENQTKKGNNDEFTKKNRKKYIKENQKYRPKRQRF